MSRSTRRMPGPTDRASTVMKAVPGRGLGDASSAQLKTLGKSAGNEALEGKLKQAGGMRDELLKFIVQRLQNMQQVQAIEQGEMGRERQWFRALARGAPGYFLPDPTRWHEAAHLFKDAAKALARGDLARGGELLERALEAERAAYRSLPTMVTEELDSTNDSAAAPPAELGHMASLGACGAVALPKGIEAADRILNIGDVMEGTPPLNRRRGNAWWLDEEEEEEEEGDDKKK